MAPAPAGMGVSVPYSLAVPCLHSRHCMRVCQPACPLAILAGSY